MPAAHKGAPIGSVRLRTHRERLIRTKLVHEICGRLDRRRRGGEEVIARATRPKPAVGARVGDGPVFLRWCERTNPMRATLPRIGVKVV
jgi:hypothetical protein